MEVTIIRKVELSMDEQKKYEVIKSLADHPAPNKQRAALTLGCTVRHINRMLKGYKEHGKAYFIHGNRGRKPANTIPNETRNLVALEDAHSRRPRAAYFGELQQMDATPYEWIPGQIWHLHLAIDDATGRITGGWFDTQETLNGYYHVFHQILTTYGIPYKFFTDRRTVFTYKKKNSPSIDEDTYTQFAYACKQLGVELGSSSVPQAKGRVERLNQTLQSRLPVELRLAGITTIDAANEFLNSYIKEFNEKFSLPIHGIKSVFEVQPKIEKINLILAVLCERTVDTGHCLRHSNKYYRMIDSRGNQVHYRKGTKVMFIQAFDGSQYCCVNDKDIYALEEIPEHETKSKDLDIDYTPPKPKKPRIPPMNHPWRRQQFGKFVKQQEHHQNDQDTKIA